MLLNDEVLEVVSLVTVFILVSYVIIHFLRRGKVKGKEKKPRPKGNLENRYKNLINGITRYEKEEEVRKFLEDENSLLVVAVHEGDCFLYKKKNVLMMIDCGNSTSSKIKSNFEVLEVIICVWKFLVQSRRQHELLFFITHGDKDHYMNYLNLKKICDIITFGDGSPLEKKFGQFLGLGLDNLYGNQSTIKEIDKKVPGLCKNIECFLDSDLGEAIDKSNGSFLSQFIFTSFDKHNKGKEKNDKNENGIVFIQSTQDNSVDVCFSGDNYNWVELILPNEEKPPPRISVLTYPHHGSSYGTKGELTLNKIQSGRVVVQKCIVTRSRHHSLDPFAVLSQLIDNCGTVFTTYRKGDLKTVKSLKWKGVKGLEMKHPEQEQRDKDDFKFDSYYENRLQVLEKMLLELKEKYRSEEHTKLIQKIQENLIFVEKCMYFSLSGDGEEYEGEDSD